MIDKLSSLEVTLSDSIETLSVQKNIASSLIEINPVYLPPRPTFEDIDGAEVDGAADEHVLQAVASDKRTESHPLNQNDDHSHPEAAHEAVVTTVDGALVNDITLPVIVPTAATSAPTPITSLQAIIDYILTNIHTSHTTQQTHTTQLTSLTTEIKKNDLRLDELISDHYASKLSTESTLATYDKRYHILERALTETNNTLSLKADLDTIDTIQTTIDTIQSNIQQSEQKHNLQNTNNTQSFADIQISIDSCNKQINKLSSLKADRTDIIDIHESTVKSEAMVSKLTTLFELQQTQQNSGYVTSDYLDTILLDKVSKTEFEDLAYLLTQSTAGGVTGKRHLRPLNKSSGGGGGSSGGGGLEDSSSTTVLSAARRSSILHSAGSNLRSSFSQHVLTKTDNLSSSLGLDASFDTAVLPPLRSDEDISNNFEAYTKYKKAVSQRASFNSNKTPIARLDSLSGRDSTALVPSLRSSVRISAYMPMESQRPSSASTPAVDKSTKAPISARGTGKGREKAVSERNLGYGIGSISGHAHLGMSDSVHSDTSFLESSFPASSHNFDDDPANDAVFIETGTGTRKLPVAQVTYSLTAGGRIQREEAEGMLQVGGQSSNDFYRYDINIAVNIVVIPTLPHRIHTSAYTTNMHINTCYTMYTTVL